MYFGYSNVSDIKIGKIKVIIYVIKLHNYVIIYVPLNCNNSK